MQDSSILKQKSFRILCLGPLWRGSNAGGLFKALSRLGHQISIIDEFYFFNFNSKKKYVKVFDKLLRPFHLKEYNDAILNEANIFQPHIVLVYKGAFVTRQTVLQLKKIAPVVNFFPDISFFNHTQHLSECIPHYDYIFTTKTFGVKDLHKIGINNVAFIPHGYDPEIHRLVKIPKEYQQILSCDVSFIGTYSPKKEKILEYLYSKLPELNLKIWGNQWEKAKSNKLKDSIQYGAIYGDIYVAAIRCSKINLGLLLEKVGNASDGDRITSRTFHIPASGGFLLHERTEESVKYFKENVEASFFESNEELVHKVRYYLDNPDVRNEICIRGLKRANLEHSLDHRAKMLLDIIDENLPLTSFL